MIEVVTSPPADLDLVDRKQTLLKTPRVVEWGRKHFACKDLVGIEMEDDGGKFTAGSHWEKRHVMNEFMSGAPSGFANVKSIFTLALLEDSGWYRANYSHADPLRWGYMYGCGFMTSCDSKTPDPPEGFCKKQTGLQCSFDRSALGKCHSEGEKISLPYTSSTFIGTNPVYGDSDIKI